MSIVCVFILDNGIVRICLHVLTWKRKGGSMFAIRQAEHTGEYE